MPLSFGYLLMIADVAWSAPWRVQLVLAVATTLMFLFRAFFSHACHAGDCVLPGVPPRNAIWPPFGRSLFISAAYWVPGVQMFVPVTVMHWVPALPMLALDHSATLSPCCSAAW